MRSTSLSRNRAGAVVASVVLAALLLAGAPLAVAATGDNCGTRTCDSSGHGYDLDVKGDPLPRFGPTGKYSSGYDLDGGDDLTVTDDAFQLRGDVSMTAAFTLDTFPPSGEVRPIVHINDGGSFGGIAKVLIDSNGRIGWDNNNQPQTFSSEKIDRGFHTVAARAFDNGDGTRDVWIWVFDDAGVEVVDFFLNDAAKPNANGPGVVNIGASKLDGGVYEVRIWDRYVPYSTLDAITDPTLREDAGYENQAEGSELALWFLGPHVPVPGLEPCTSSGVCVATSPTTKITDLHRPTARPAATATVTAELGTFRVDVAGEHAETALAWTQVDGGSDPSVLEQSVGPVTTSYTHVQDVCVDGTCEFVAGADADPAGEQVGELWRARLKVFVDGTKVADVPVTTVRLA